MEEKQTKIENLAIELFQNKLGFTLKKNISPETRQKLINTPDFKEFLDQATVIVEKREKNVKNIGKYPVIQVESSGKRQWIGGARTMCFVYSKNHGNFILEGYREEVEEHLKKYYTHYFCYYSMWYRGMCRGTWKFWKDSVGIFEPSRRPKDKRWKWEVRLYTGGRSKYITVEESDESKLVFKRLPHRWIPEFDRF